jgi:pyruvate dehydrogenase E1 component beta subunit
VLASVRRTGRLVVVHEAGPMCGLGAEVVARVVQQGFEALRAAPQRVTSPDVPVPAAPQLERAFVPGIERIVEAALRLCEPALA